MKTLTVDKLNVNLEAPGMEFFPNMFVEYTADISWIIYELEELIERYVDIIVTYHVEYQKRHLEDYETRHARYEQFIGDTS